MQKCSTSLGWCMNAFFLNKIISYMENTIYSSKNHSKFRLHYHLIFVCKYRKKLLTILSDDIKQILFEISQKYDFDIETMEVDKDHIHLLITSAPKLSPKQIVRVLKQESTIKICKMHKSILNNHFLERTYILG